MSTAPADVVAVGAGPSGWSPHPKLARRPGHLPATAPGSPLRRSLPCIQPNIRQFHLAGRSAALNRCGGVT